MSGEAREWQVRGREESRFRTRFLTIGGIILWCLLAAFWQLITFRMLGLGALIVAVCLSPGLIRRRKTKLLAAAWLFYVAMTLIPIDITFLSYPGPPRFVPLVMGLPGEATFKRAKRGEIVLGGCMVSGFEPRWVLVW